ncbi:MAG TPA: hypothetical protein VFV99_25700 [Kofleriaceae bacterium]|nr:hypothetical protein [Kofleriaceae bacterium]
MRNVLFALCAVASCKGASRSSEPATTTPPATEAGTPTVATASADAATSTATPVAIPGGEHGIGFDDLRFARGIGRVVAPAGGTGTIALIDPATRALTTIAGFGATTGTTGHEDGSTSADESAGHLYAIDRTKLEVVLIDEKTAKIVGSAKLASSPDYVRWVEATHELWVTQPDEYRIEVFTLTGTTPKHAAFIAVTGGPESLVIDGKRAFTHLWKGTTVVLDVTTRKQTASWPNGCTGSRGIALDGAHNILFVGCGEGRAVALDASSGKQLDVIVVGAGVDIIDFNPKLSHLYVPSAKTATFSIIGVAAGGKFSLLGTAEAALGAHCVTADDRNHAWVCDPKAGRLLEIEDTYPASL